MILKAQLAQATGRAIEAVWQVSPGARAIHPEPVIYVHAAENALLYDVAMAQGYSKSMFEGWDMVAGRLCPESEGKERYLDVLGINYYPHHQWVFSHEPYNPSQAVGRDHPRYRPFRLILADIWERYHRPMFIAETGSEEEDRVAWLRYLCHEVRGAMEIGVPIEGICLYPIVNCPAGDDGVHLHNGVWDSPADITTGDRETYMPLLREIRRQMRLFREHAGTTSAE